MKKVLVIGGSGFIGKNIIETYKNNGYFVGSYSMIETPTADISFEGNIADDSNFKNIMKAGNWDLVIYLITTVNPKKSMDNPESTYINDVPYFVKTLEECKNNNIKRVVFASSGGTIYGDIGHKKAVENMETQPINNYAIGKLCCEKILLMYNRLYNMENISLRISNPFGKYQDPNSGIGAITIFTNKIINNEKITIFGKGDIVRDYVDVKDVANAFYLASEYKFDNNITPIFNVGSGKGLSLLNIIEIVSDTLNIKPNIEFLEERSFDVKYNLLDLEKSKKYLNYSPSEVISNINTYINDNYCERNKKSK